MSAESPIPSEPKKITTIDNTTILRPGGNDTALIPLIVPSPLRKEVNNKIMSLYSNVEQVGFFDLRPKNPDIDAVLIMAGGEFCGNATRCVAYLALNGKPGEIRIAVSGTKQVLRAGVTPEATAWAQMPIIKNSSCFRQEGKLLVVNLEGITHVIYPAPLKSIEEAKKEASQILENLNLKTSKPAAGVLFLEETPRGLKMDPFVWVRNIGTFFYETACASGTAAVGLAKSLLDNKSLENLPVIQPSGQIIYSSITRSPDGLIEEIIINGPIRVLENNITIQV